MSSIPPPTEPMPAVQAEAGVAASTQAEAAPFELKNRAGESRSPYVRGHASNPVAWQLWTEDTLKLAKEKDRLIFLSVGYTACHWCHVMERESFENADVAQVLNNKFIPIKLDREERPDLDRIYMNYVQATTGGGGWPLNVFLTPDLEPLFGGTYWPGPSSSTTVKDSVDFMSILKKMETIWREQRDRCMSSAKEITKQLREFAQEGLVSRDGIDKDAEGDDMEIELLDETFEHFNLKYDRQYAGFGIQPKFPTPINLRFLLALSQYPQEVKDVLGEEDVQNARMMAIDTLKAMWLGGIKDQVGHGFARYSVTRDWSLPHFEKMLYDQVQLLPAYLDAYLLTKEQQLLDATIDIVTYLTSPPMAREGGGFFSSEDADSYYRASDSEKREGAFYVWALKELTTILGEHDADVCARHWNVQENGNVQPEFDAHDELMNQNVLAVTKSAEAIAKELGLTEEAVLKTLADGREKLRKHRETERPRPMLDDKVVLSWNGLAISALARTGASLAKVQPDVSKTSLDAAIKTAEFLKTSMVDQETNQMRRVFREGLGDAPAFADDYAFLIGGLIDLYEATWDEQWLEWADELQKTQIKLFWDDAQDGFFSTAAGQADLILRLKDGMDNAEPSTNGFSARNLYRLGAMLEDTSYAKLAKRTVHAFEAEILQHPFLFAGMMDSVIVERLGKKSLVIRGQGEKVDEYIQKMNADTGIARTVVRIGKENKWLRERNTLLKDIDGEKEGIMVCEGQTCKEVAFDEAQEPREDNRAFTSAHNT